MSATSAMVAELRRMTDEPEEATYDDDLLETIIERYPVQDILGTEPWEWDGTTSPPTASENDDWIPTYDLHAAAADIWQEKSATVAEDYNFTADGSTLSRGDVQKQYMNQSRHHLSRRKIKTMRTFVTPRVSPNVEDNSD